MSNQGALSATKMWLMTGMPGALSRPPQGTTT